MHGGIAQDSQMGAQPDTSSNILDDLDLSLNSLEQAVELLTMRLASVSRPPVPVDVYPSEVRPAMSRIREQLHRIDLIASTVNAIRENLEV